MMPPRISVVIPVHDRPALLDRAIASVLDQTCPVHEIVVIDDGSHPPLDLAALAKRDPRICGIRLDTNRGAAAARNAGLRAARCDWVAFLDSDDRWLPDKIARQLDTLGGHATPHGVLAATNILVRRPDHADRPYNLSLPRLPISEWILVDGATLQTSTLLLPREDALAMGFDETLRRHQDWDFALRYLRSGARLVYDATPLAIYDASDDHPRMSARITVAGTLHWLARAGDVVTPLARLSYYLRAIFPADLRRAPMPACARLVRFTAACPGGMRFVVVTVIRRFYRALAGSIRRNPAPRSTRPSSPTR